MVRWWFKSRTITTMQHIPQRGAGTTGRFCRKNTWMLGICLNNFVCNLASERNEKRTKEKHLTATTTAGAAAAIPILHFQKRRCDEKKHTHKNRKKQQLMNAPNAFYRYINNRNIKCQSFYFSPNREKRMFSHLACISVVLHRWPFQLLKWNILTFFCRNLNWF